jgi:hypothetical protein
MLSNVGRFFQKEGSMNFGKILAVFTACGLIFGSQAALANQEIFGARVCAGEDSILSYCDASVDVSTNFSVTGWNNAQVYVSSGKQIIPESDRIVIKKRGFYRIVFEGTVFYTPTVVAQTPDIAGEVQLDVNGSIVAGCGAPPAKAGAQLAFADGFFVTECTWTGTLPFRKGDAIKLNFGLSDSPGAPSFVQFRLDVSRLR